MLEKEEPITHDPIMAPPKDYQPASAAPITDDQQLKLDQLRTYMDSILLPSTHDYYESEKRFLTEGTLKRYMRARKWDYEVRKVWGVSQSLPPPSHKRPFIITTNPLLSLPT